MPTGDPFILGKSNSADKATRLSATPPLGLETSIAGESAVAISAKVDGKSSIALNGSATAANSIAVNARVDNSGSIGVNSSAGGESSIGVNAQASGKTSIAVNGHSSGEASIALNGTASGEVSMGVLGQASGKVPTGCAGIATGDVGVGVVGIGKGNLATGVVGIANDPQGTGTIGIANGNGGTGIVGVASKEGGLAAQFVGTVVVNGAFFVTGFKAAAVPHRDGSHRVFCALECPESWFEDFGRAKLKQGKARIKLDRDFAACVNTVDYHVFVTPEGACNGLCVTKRQRDGFVVEELQKGTSSAPFSYRIVARRKDTPAGRMKKIRLPALNAAKISAHASGLVKRVAEASSRTGEGKRLRTKA